jgi:ArsR family transcriptional regulator
MELIRIYECLCDPTRLRLLNLLGRGPLCVCQFQDILGEPQAKVAKHLGYLRTRGLVRTKRDGNWIIYRLAENRLPELDAHLRCLQDCVRENRVFTRDLSRLRRLMARVAADRSCACPSLPCHAG